jgi:outer membrane immunogenic protein
VKRVFAAAVLAASFVMPAAAADVPVKGPVYKAAPTAFDWSGWYGGVDLGYLGSKGDVINNGTGVVAGSDPDGFVGGVHLGYRRQLPSSRLVLGIEADFWGSSANGEAQYSGPVNFAPVDINWGASVRGIVGIAMSPTLLYLTGGVAFIDIDGCTNGGLGTPCGANTQFGSTLTGWTAGVGLAHAFSPRMIARIEYLYADFGDKTYTTPGVAGGLTTLDLQTHTIRGGLSWRFTTR